jgi:hypothetical protein
MTHPILTYKQRRRRQQPRISSLFAALTLSLGLSACSLSSPITLTPAFKASKTGHETLLVAITEAGVPLEREARRRFWKHTIALYRNLGPTPGLVAYGVRRSLSGDLAWTVTIWADSNAMRQFVKSEAHMNAVYASFSDLTSARFAQAEISSAQWPVTWNQIDGWLQTQSRSYTPGKPSKRTYP